MERKKERARDFSWKIRRHRPCECTCIDFPEVHLWAMIVGCGLLMCFGWFLGSTLTISRRLISIYAWMRGIRGIRLVLSCWRIARNWLRLIVLMVCFFIPIIVLLKARTKTRGELIMSVQAIRKIMSRSSTRPGVIWRRMGVWLWDRLDFIIRKWYVLSFSRSSSKSYVLLPLSIPIHIQTATKPPPSSHHLHLSTRPLTHSCR